MTCKSTNTNWYEKYMEAVDTVCLNCVYDGNDSDAGVDYCDNCMVRKSVIENEPKQIHDTDKFKMMFSNYCNGEIEAGHCDSFLCCEFCDVNKAWNRIFGNDVEDQDTFDYAD